MQRHFLGHDDDILCCAVHPDKTTVVTGQVGNPSDECMCAQKDSLGHNVQKIVGFACTLCFNERVIVQAQVFTKRWL